MTLSMARGFTLRLSAKFLEDQTLTAITKDVRYVFKEIANQRESGAVA